MIQIEVGGRRHAVLGGRARAWLAIRRRTPPRGPGCAAASCDCGTAIRPARRPSGSPRRRPKCGSTGSGSGPSRPRCCMATRSRCGGHELRVVDERTLRQHPDDGGLRLPGAGRPQPPAGDLGSRRSRVGWCCLTDGREYAITGSGLVFGRDAACEVVIASTEVSRRHAEIRPGPKGYVITDSSANGTLVNGQRMPGVPGAGARRRHPHRRRGVPLLCRSRSRPWRRRS